MSPAFIHAAGLCACVRCMSGLQWCCTMNAGQLRICLAEAFRACCPPAGPWIQHFNASSPSLCCSSSCLSLCQHPDMTSISCEWQHHSLTKPACMLQDIFTSLTGASKPHHVVDEKGVVLGYSHFGMLAAARYVASGSACKRMSF